MDSVITKIVALSLLFLLVGFLFGTWVGWRLTKSGEQKNE